MSGFLHTHTHTLSLSLCGVHVCMRMCACVCVCERERGIKRERDELIPNFSYAWIMCEFVWVGGESMFNCSVHDKLTGHTPQTTQGCEHFWWWMSGTFLCPAVLSRTHRCCLQSHENIINIIIIIYISRDKYNYKTALDNAKCNQPKLTCLQSSKSSK